MPRCRGWKCGLARALEHWVFTLVVSCGHANLAAFENPRWNCQRGFFLENRQLAGRKGVINQSRHPIGFNGRPNPVLSEALERLVGCCVGEARTQIR